MKPFRPLPILFLGALTLGAAAASGQPAPTFGTSSPILYHVGYTEFTPDTSTAYGKGTSSHRGRSNPSGTTDLFLYASLHLPSGARLVSFELDSCDFPSGSAQNIVLTLLDCDKLGANCTEIGPTLQSGNGCTFQTADLTLPAYTVENSSHQLLLQAMLDIGTGSISVLLGAYVGYTLQVSPGPATATFSDVPTNSPLFQYVEALSAAGITAGCGGGDFCPAAPLTRGQMAVFLSVALGLHFPN
jgi:S-layer homology domain